jgi:hypothetical protein
MQSSAHISSWNRLECMYILCSNRGIIAGKKASRRKLDITLTETRQKMLTCRRFLYKKEKDHSQKVLRQIDCEEIGGMKIDRGNRSTGRKPAPASLCPPQIPHDWTRVWTRAAAVGSQRLTAWAMARPRGSYYLHLEGHFYHVTKMTSRHIIFTGVIT